MFDFGMIPGIVGGLKSLFGGDNGQGAANRASANALKQQKELLDLMKGIVTGMDKSGAFSGQDQLAQARQDYQTAVGDIMGQGRIMGYQPGDTPVNDSLTSRTLDYAKLARDIRQGANAAKLSAYGMLNPAGYGQLAQGWQQQSQLAAQGAPNWAGLASAMIQGMDRGPGSTTSRAASNNSYAPGSPNGGTFNIPTVSWAQPTNYGTWAAPGLDAYGFTGLPKR